MTSSVAGEPATTVAPASAVTPWLSGRIEVVNAIVPPEPPEVGIADCPEPDGLRETPGPTPNAKSLLDRAGVTTTLSRTMPNALLGASVDTKSSWVVAPDAVKEACPLSYESTAGEKAGDGAGP